MTDYFVSNGGSNTSPYDTWAKAATSLATALAAASTDGDRVIIQYDSVPAGDNELGADTGYTAAAAIELISSTNSGTATITPTAMGTSAWIGNSTTNRSISISSAATKTLFVYGLTLRTAGSTGDAISLQIAAGELVADSCYLWQGNTATTQAIFLCSATTTAESYVTLKDCTLRFGATAQSVALRSGGVTLEGCTVSSAGSAITTLFTGSAVTGAAVSIGCDFSHVNTTLVGDQTNQYRPFTFVNCKLPASYVIAAATTAAGKSGCDVWLYDCHSGDEHIHIAHANGLGSTVIDTGIYANDNIADSNLSWKVVGAAVATATVPYQSPWISVYHAGTSEITPYLECVRSGSDTAYNNNQVWSEWAYKGTSGTTRVTLVNDRTAVAGSAAAQASSSKGASDWTGENATSWFGKLGPVASFTPAEAGHISARVCVAGANTVYVDPQIRGLS